MNVTVLGSGAGGGLPQWNCACANCRDARTGVLEARTQDSIAVSADGERWIVCNASPDIRLQLARTLHPTRPRQAPFAAIVLTSGDVDHCLGLFDVRESTPLVVYATEAVWRGLVEHNALARTLQRFDGHLTWHRLELGRRDTIAGLGVTPIGVPGKPPLHLRDRVAPSREDNIGLVFDDGSHRVGYVPGAAGIDIALGALDALLFDGTFWSEDELIRLELGTARASDMAHVPVTASLSAFPQVARKLYTHVNNTNPIVRADSPERAAVVAAGWDVASDGTRLAL